MDVTTVKLHHSTKSALDQIKHGNESYDDVIERLISENKKKSLPSELIKAYKSLGKEDRELLEEWESASRELEQ